MTLFPNDFRSAQEKYVAFQPFFRADNSFGKQPNIKKIIVIFQLVVT